MTDVSFDLNSSIGAVECGAMISNLLFGFVTKQVFVYYQNYPRDRWQLKALVRISLFFWHRWTHGLGNRWLLYGAAVTVLIFGGICWTAPIQAYRIGTNHLRHARNLRDNCGGPWSARPDNPPNVQDIVLLQLYHCYYRPGQFYSFFPKVKVTLPSQVFYAYRLTKCFSKPYCACICLVLTLFQCLGFLIFLAEWNFQSPKFSIISSAGFYAAGTADFLIAIFLSYYLIENRRNSSQTRSVIRYIILYESAHCDTFPSEQLTFWTNSSWKPSVSSNVGKPSHDVNLFALFTSYWAHNGRYCKRYCDLGKIWITLTKMPFTDVFGIRFSFLVLVCNRQLNG